jgi:hypothetical protein
MRAEAIERFWSKVERGNGCWTWTASKNAKGYGKCAPRHWRRQEYAHRVSWEIANGPIPDGMQVLHHCDNPSCVRPGHLFLGTHQDNMADMVSKGRQRNGPLPGESNGRAKLTRRQVDAIRRRVERGETKLRLAKEYGVSRATVQFICKGVTWNT